MNFLGFVINYTKEGSHFFWNRRNPLKTKKEPNRVRKENKKGRYLIHVDKKLSDETSAGNQIGSDIFDTAESP